MSENAYKQAGVDVEAGYESVRLIKDDVKKTTIEGVLGGIGGFGGLFEMPKNYENPVLVSGTDGVGTKIRVAFLMDKHDTIGQDCVAMCVNDIACSGAKPLFFLDYIAIGKNVPEKVAQIVKGVADGCVLSGCALVGGETAEHPGMMPEDEYDVAGFSVGVVEKSKITDGKNAKAGNVLIGIASSGVHSNGYSLVRKVFGLNDNNAKETLNTYSNELGKTIGEELLTPTRIYVKPLLKLIDEVGINTVSHITGGGFIENVPRMLPDGLKAGITVICLWGLFILFFSTIIPLAIREFQSLGNVSVSNIVSELESPIEDAGHFMKHYGLMDEDQDVDAYVTDLLSKVFNVGQLKTWFGTVAGTMTDIFVALFSITFILFFFLKDSRLFSGMVMAVLPSRFEEQARNALDSIQKLLVRYFVGLLLEVLGVMALNTIGLTIVGLGFSNAVVIGLVTGVLNVIPYIGPMIGVFFGLAVGVVLNLGLDFYDQMLPLLIYMTIAMLLTQLIDNVVFQPFIYGSSVHAHPLEIFLVILMAGSMAGILGMILAIPSYTVLRVVLKEFFNKYKLVKKLTQSLNE